MNMALAKLLGMMMGNPSLQPNQLATDDQLAEMADANTDPDAKYIGKDGTLTREPVARPSFWTRGAYPEVAAEADALNNAGIKQSIQEGLARDSFARQFGDANRALGNTLPSDVAGMYGLSGGNVDINTMMNLRRQLENNSLNTPIAQAKDDLQRAISSEAVNKNTAVEANKLAELGVPARKALLASEQLDSDRAILPSSTARTISGNELATTDNKFMQANSPVRQALQQNQWEQQGYDYNRTKGIRSQTERLQDNQREQQEYEYNRAKGIRPKAEALQDAQMARAAYDALSLKENTSSMMDYSLNPKTGKVEESVNPYYLSPQAQARMMAEGPVKYYDELNNATRKGIEEKKATPTKTNVTPTVVRNPVLSQKLISQSDYENQLSNIPEEQRNQVQRALLSQIGEVLGVNRSNIGSSVIRMPMFYSVKQQLNNKDFQDKVNALTPEQKSEIFRKTLSEFLR